MAVIDQPEVWLRGPLPGIIPALQPVAHALLQAREELAAAMQGFDDALLWQRPAGVASAGFHLRHMAGVLNRLCTYARGQALQAEQLKQLATEDIPLPQQQTLQQLLLLFNQAVDDALAQLHTTGNAELFEIRGVGRAQIPSTVMGLLVHAAEHTMRHLGQLLVTTRVLSAGKC